MGDSVFLSPHGPALASKSEDALVETHVSASSTAQITGVLLMAHGSPDNLDDMGAYLQHVRGGRATTGAGGRHSGALPVDRGARRLDLTRARGKPWKSDSIVMAYDFGSMLACGIGIHLSKTPCGRWWRTVSTVSWRSAWRPSTLNSAWGVSTRPGNGAGGVRCQSGDHP